ncbi:phosphate/phosphite/phosphonate ABC transporter substrate-binding protein [Halalkalibacter akibai]|uniref:Phosphonate ABC transporter phosphate-binding periplasmic component n=1 Tax=Halalkalibacter akibai (strain ATCC 43226 / DSM 21942 / CIP 109018 / JCM 9157 / 1139) TaxID=1236973 RepID=W4QZ27_HALA3|nr:phosphate/phosphite/phosphonate ABC transporter substrate-binding protein [Halalkalibacter akibai]GAE37331.1 phosphonate ABC transporter phosphate-binding periplasmic component [Halalkalibacter akibai JCM 9157]
MKKTLLSIFMLMMLVALAACGAGTTDEETTDPVETEEAGEAAPEETATEGEEITEIRMGFIPSQEADKIADTVKPLEEKLTEILGVPVRAEVMIDFVGLVEGMRTGQIDIGFLNPFGFVQAENRANVEVLVKAIRRGEDSYVAQYVAPADSELESIEDIVNTPGLVWAYADTLSTSGYLFPASQLADMGADLTTHFSPLVVGGHDNAILALIDGQADFATTFDDARDVLEGDYPDVKERLKVIGYTEPIPNDTLSVRGDMSDEWKQKIKEAFLAFNDDEEMIAVMNEVYTWDGIAEAASADYDVVRAVFEKFEEDLAN